MKKFKNIRQLRQHKKKMRQREAELQKNMRSDLRELGNSLKPMNFLKSSLGLRVEKKKNGNWVDRVTDKAADFTKHIIDKAENKVAEKVGKVFLKIFR